MHSKCSILAAHFNSTHTIKFPLDLTRGKSTHSAPPDFHVWAAWTETAVWCTPVAARGWKMDLQPFMRHPSWGDKTASSSKVQSGWTWGVFALDWWLPWAELCPGAEPELVKGRSRAAHLTYHGRILYSGGYSKVWAKMCFKKKRLQWDRFYTSKGRQEANDPLLSVWFLLCNVFTRRHRWSFQQKLIKWRWCSSSISASYYRWGFDSAGSAAFFKTQEEKLTLPECWTNSLVHYINWSVILRWDAFVWRTFL